jgi:hypothetical protein
LRSTLFPAERDHRDEQREKGDHEHRLPRLAIRALDGRSSDEGDEPQRAADDRSDASDT